MPTREEEGEALLRRFGETKYTEGYKEGYSDAIVKGCILGVFAMILGGFLNQAKLFQNNIVCIRKPSPIL